MQTCGGVIPRTVIANTAKGRHVWFTHPGVEIRNTVRLGHVPLDVRGDGGYVVVPPIDPPEREAVHVAPVAARLLAAGTDAGYDSSSYCGRPREQTRTRTACSEPRRSVGRSFARVDRATRRPRSNSEAAAVRTATPGTRNDTLNRRRITRSARFVASGDLPRRRRGARAHLRREGRWPPRDRKHGARSRPRSARGARRDGRARHASSLTSKLGVANERPRSARCRVKPLSALIACAPTDLARPRDLVDRRLRRARRPEGRRQDVRAARPGRRPWRSANPGSVVSIPSTARVLVLTSEDSACAPVATRRCDLPRAIDREPAELEGQLFIHPQVFSAPSPTSTLLTAELDAVEPGLVVLDPAYRYMAGVRAAALRYGSRAHAAVRGVRGRRRRPRSSATTTTAATARRARSGSPAPDCSSGHGS